MRRLGFGRMILGVRPDYIIRVRADVLEEVDGPMLRHGLQGLQGQRILGWCGGHTMGGFEPPSGAFGGTFQPSAGHMTEVMSRLRMG